jgi:hypothetical protein
VCVCVWLVMHNDHGTDDTILVIVAVMMLLAHGLMNDGGRALIRFYARRRTWFLVG